MSIQVGPDAEEATWAERFFGAGSALAKRPGYVPRAGQIGMAQRVYEAMNRHRGHLLAEAGTGVGKSYAYLVPAMQAVNAGKKVVVATAQGYEVDNIALELMVGRWEIEVLDADGSKYPPP